MDTPRQTHCVRNSIFPHFVMVITCCGPTFTLGVKGFSVCHPFGGGVAPSSPPDQFLFRFNLFNFSFSYSEKFLYFWIFANSNCYQWSITTIYDTETHFCVQHRNLFPFSLCLLPMEHYYDIKHGNSFLCPTQRSVSISFFLVAVLLYFFVPHTNGALLWY